MPNGWTALKCEGCGNSLEMVGEMPGLLILQSPKAAEALCELGNQLSESRTWNRIPILAGDLEPEFVKNPFAGMLRCASCGLLYERYTDGDE